MFEESRIGDRVFVALIIAFVVAMSFGIYSYMNRPDGRASPTKDVLHLEAITDVYECERDGQRIVRDRPCGSGVPIRVLPDEKAAK